MEYKVGDLIEAAKSGEVNIIAHGANCFCTMGSGIAPLIKRAFPAAYDADQSTIKGATAKLGTYTVGRDADSSVVVYNLYSQHGFWGRNKGQRDLNYNALYDALDTMSKDISLVCDLEEVRVGLPKIGSGLAGGSWHVIQAMIEDTFVKRGITTTIYVLDAKEIPAGGVINA